MHIKLTDFGSAKVFPIVGGKVSRSGHPPAATGEGDAPATPKPSFVGTAEYVSPEVLLNDPTTESSVSASLTLTLHIRSLTTSFDPDLVADPTFGRLAAFSSS